ncbi:MAG: hypothetical protein Q9217_005307 [Psora testacea]
MAHSAPPPDGDRTTPARAAVAKPAPASIGACDACRARKVRCLASENTMSNKCQRCARAGRECVYTVHSKTRRRKRTDTRVKELEEKVKNLSVLLQTGRNGSTQSVTHTSKQASADTDEGMEDEYEDISDDLHDGDEHLDYDGEAAFNGTDCWKNGADIAHRRKSKESVQLQEQKLQNSFNVAGYDDGNLGDSSGISPDVVARGLLTMEEATELFDRYVNVLSPNFPAIIFPPGTCAAEIRSKRPILFLAVIAAGAGAAHPALNLKLNQEILQLYATKVALEGQKNLDLVQSILISSLWYYPPERFDQLKFHQYIHMAATMALDLGLGKRPRIRRQHQHTSPAWMQTYEPQRTPGSELTLSKLAPDSSSLECRRTLLACYLQCAAVSMSLRLPNALRFTSYMGECLDVLETSPDAAPTDRRFTAWIRVQRIVEDCVNTFSLDDPESTVSLADVRVQTLLRGYEKQMEEWRKALEPGTLDSFLEINFHINNIYIHEISLHPDHEPEDFRPPYYVATQLTSKIPTRMNPAYVNAIMECFSSAQAVLSTFVDMNISTIRALPAMFFVRITYSCVVLIKLELSSSAPASELGKVLDCDSLNLPSQLEKVVRHQIAVVGSEGKNILAAKFLMIMKTLVRWYKAYKSQPALSNEKRGGTESGLELYTKYQTTETPKQHTQPKLAQSMPQQYGLPNFDNLPANTFQPFSGVVHHPPAPALGQPFNGFISAPANATTTAATEQQMQQAPYDYHQALLAAKTNSPSADYSSPEHYPPGGGGGERNGSNSMSPPVSDSKMEVDPSMFGQLQGIGEPFTYNPDPNDWMFDWNMNGGDGMGMGEVGIPEFEWGPVGMQ